MSFIILMTINSPYLSLRRERKASDDGFLGVLHLGGGEIAKRVVLRVEVFRESHKSVVLHF